MRCVLRPIFMIMVVLVSISSIANAAHGAVRAEPPQAMVEANEFVVRHTQIPVLAPTSLRGVAPIPILSAHASAGPAFYKVQLFKTPPKTLPLNDPHLGPRYAGGAWSYGGYGATRYGSQELAQSFMNSISSAMHCARTFSTLRARSIDLYDGVVAQRVGNTDCLAWKEAGARYILESSLATPALTIEDANMLAKAGMEFAPAKGDTVSMVGAASNGTTVYWRRGRVVYWAGNDHYAMAALAMARDVRLVVRSARPSR